MIPAGYVTNDVRDPFYAYLASQVIRCLSEGLPDTFTADVCRGLWPDATFVHVEDDYHPRYVAVVRPLESIVFLTGVLSITDVAKLIVGYSLPTGQHLVGEMPLPTYFRAAEGVAKIDNALPVANRTLTLWGHSWGGAIAEGIAYLYATRAFNVPHRIRVGTLGSPKALTQFGSDTLQGTIISRFMAKGDPVPFLPPVPSEWGSTSDTLSLPLELVYRRWHHAGLGYVLSGSGEPFIQALPSNSDKPSDSLILAFATHGHLPTLTEHTVRHYEQLLRFLPSTVKALTLIQSVPAVATVAQRQIPVTIPLQPNEPGVQDMAGFGSTFGPKVHFNGTAYDITLKGQLIGTVPTKSKGLIFKKYLLKMFTRLYRGGTWDATALSDGITNAITSMASGEPDTPGPLP